MRWATVPAAMAAVLALAASGAKAGPAPISLHPDNTRIFLFRGKPAVLIGSGEHYGALLNLDFDYAAYFTAMEKDGLNKCRIFAGTYCEAPGSFHIENNTLAPAKGRLVSPWARSGEMGYAGGGNKFDLTKFDPAYFERLKKVLAEAGKHGVVVELSLFCPMYEEILWTLSPMNARNNVNGIGAVARDKVYIIGGEEKLLAAQEEAARRIVEACAEFDNVYFEICNEPYFGGVQAKWQERIAQVVSDAEKGLTAKHLIARNIAKDWAKVERPIEHVSIYNFHYANPPKAVGENWELKCPIAYDETGFKGTGDAVYRRHAWEFVMAGGTVFDNLDYSFTVEHPDGMAAVKDPTPGGGGPALRKQLGILKRFIEGFDLKKLAPAQDVIAEMKGEAGDNADGKKQKSRMVATHALGDGKAIGVYVSQSHLTELQLKLPAGKWKAEFLNCTTGEKAGTAQVADGGWLKFPDIAGNAAARLTKAE